MHCLTGCAKMYFSCMRRCEREREYSNIAGWCQGVFYGWPDFYARIYHCWWETPEQQCRWKTKRSASEVYLVCKTNICTYCMCRWWFYKYDIKSNCTEWKNAEIPVKCFCIRFWMHTKWRKTWVVGTVDNSTIEYQRPSCGRRNSLWPTQLEQREGRRKHELRTASKISHSILKRRILREKKIMWSSIWNWMHDQGQMLQTSALKETACDIYWHITWPTTCRNICRIFIPQIWSS